MPGSLGKYGTALYSKSRQEILDIMRALEKRGLPYFHPEMKQLQGMANRALDKEQALAKATSALPAEAKKRALARVAATGGAAAGVMELANPDQVQASEMPPSLPEPSPILPKEEIQNTEESGGLGGFLRSLVDDGKMNEFQPGAMQEKSLEEPLLDPISGLAPSSKLGKFSKLGKYLGK